MSREERDRFERLQTELVELERGVAELNVALLDATRLAHAREADVALRSPELAQLEQENAAVQLEISRLEGTYAKIQTAPPGAAPAAEKRISTRTSGFIVGALAILLALIWLMTQRHT